MAISAGNGDEYHCTMNTHGWEEWEVKSKT